MEEFRALLRERLRVRGTQARLAKESGIKSPVIGHWARGETRPSPANLKRIAPALGVPYEELMRMCGYLSGESTATSVHSELEMRLARLGAIWSEYPRTVWLAILEANERVVEALSFQLPRGTPDSAEPPDKTDRPLDNSNGKSIHQRHYQHQSVAEQVMRYGFQPAVT
jgi:transcriptional regulator with XRE-family HTH domain